MAVWFLRALFSEIGTCQVVEVIQKEFPHLVIFSKFLVSL